MHNAHPMDLAQLASAVSRHAAALERMHRTCQKAIDTNEMQLDEISGLEAECEARSVSLNRSRQMAAVLSTPEAMSAVARAEAALLQAELALQSTTRRSVQHRLLLLEQKRRRLMTGLLSLCAKLEQDPLATQPRCPLPPPTHGVDFDEALREAVSRTMSPLAAVCEATEALVDHYSGRSDDEATVGLFTAARVSSQLAGEGVGDLCGIMSALTTDALADHFVRLSTCVNARTVSGPISASDGPALHRLPQPLRSLLAIPPAAASLPNRQCVVPHLPCSIGEMKALTEGQWALVRAHGKQIAADALLQFTTSVPLSDALVADVARAQRSIKADGRSWSAAYRKT